MRTSVRQFAILSLLCTFLTASGMASGAQSVRAVDIEAVERQAESLIAQGIDDERARFAPHATALAPDPVLRKIAHDRSADMAHSAPFAHEDAAGRFVADDMVRARFGHYGTVGENIMYEWDPSRSLNAETFARHAVQGWMNSEGHRANILSTQYDRAGVGVVIEGSRAYATQVFWGPPRAVRGKGHQP